MLHTNIIKYAERNEYKATDEDCLKMSWDIVFSINEQLPDEEDVVLWNLGDLFYGRLFTSQKFNQLQKFVEVMKGRHRTLNLVLGNHDKQFKQFANWKNFKPLTSQTPLSTIFTSLGFTNVYNYPVVYKNKFILSHEPIFLEKNSQFINIHGHVHQNSDLVGEYFTWNVDNYKMARKAYRDSGREPPPPTKKENWEKWMVDPKMYRNICWDEPNHYGKVRSLNELTK